MRPAHFIIYGTKTCTYCIRAKALLTSLGLSFEERDALDPENLAFLKSKGFTKIPQIYRDGEPSDETYVGGFDKLEASLKKATPV